MTDKEREIMKNARIGYGLSCADMGRVCGFGANQWRLYETGKSKPNRSNYIIIQTVTTPMGMANYLNLIPEFTRLEMGKDFDKASNIVQSIIQSFYKQSNSLIEKLNDNYFITTNSH